MLLAAVAVAYMLTVTSDGVPVTMVPMPNKGVCAERALQIMLSAPSRGPVVAAECTALGVEEPEKPASSAVEPKKG